MRRAADRREVETRLLDPLPGKEVPLFSRTSRLVRALLVVTGALPFVRADENAYIPKSSTWNYLPGREEASSPDPAAWRQLEFDDSSWETGPGPFGHGDPPYGTELTGMRHNYSTLYLRHTFVVGDLDDIRSLHAGVDYDDGFALWINGVEVARANLTGAPGDPVPHDAAALRSREPGEYEDFELPDPHTYVVVGENIVALQGVNFSRTNNDFKLDLELVDPFGPDRTPPAVVARTPAAGVTVRSLTRLEITFSEEVTGVDARDLLVSGNPASDSTGDGAGPYVFRFEAPPSGVVRIDWAPDHGILDRAAPPNALSGESWTYTLDPDAPVGDLVISEFMSVSGSTCPGGLCDEDREPSDWIEVRNRGLTDVALEGWGLTDDQGDLGKWTFPDRTLAPGEFLVVFASGKDRRPRESGELHTSFKLNNSGEYLALSTPDSPRLAVSAFAPRYPEQRIDISYGIGPSGEMTYFDPPTPGKANDTAVAIAGIVAPPVFSVPHGFFDEPLRLELLGVTPGATTRYTLDGREPTLTTGIAYDGAIEIAGTRRRAVVTLRAAAFKEGLLPSTSVTQTYIFPRLVLSQPPDPDGFPDRWGAAPVVDYEMDPEVIAGSGDQVLEGLLAIPTVSVVMDLDDLFGSRGIYSRTLESGLAWERPCSAELLYPDGRRGFQLNCGVRIHGGASRRPENAPKHGIRLVFRGAYGETKLDFPLFPGSPVESFDTIILRSGFNNNWLHENGGQRKVGTLIRDQWHRDSQLAMSGVSSHGIHAHLYINGLYWGVYNPCERPSAPFFASHFGGEKEEYDAMNSGEAVDGDARAWNDLLDLARKGVSGRESYLEIGRILDMPYFVDYMLVNFYGANQDWPSHNWYAARRREGGQWRFICWDAERTLEGVGTNNTVTRLEDSPGIIYAQLRENAEFRLLFADRVHRHLFNGGPLTPETTAARWIARADDIDLAILGEEARWGDYRRDAHRWRDAPFEFYRRATHWLVEKQRLLQDFFPARSSLLVGQLRQGRLYPDVGAPVFSQHGGRIEPGFELEMSLPDGPGGDIHYTTDGSDPRVFGSGDPSPAASLYAGPISFTDRTHLKARTLQGTTWSALNEAVFTVAEPHGAVRITEIMYNSGGEPEVEFLEIHNRLDVGVELSGLRFRDGVRYAFPDGSALEAGEFAVLVADIEAFSERYPDVPVAGEFQGRLANDGETITLVDSRGETVVSVAYDDGDFWPLSPDGFGFSLVIRDPDAADQVDLDRPSAWRASAEPGGSPGAADPLPAHGGVVINEILTRARAPLEDAIELYNPTGVAIDIGGWFLSDSRASASRLRKFRIPDGTMVPAGGYAVFYENQFDAPDSDSGFAFDSAGDDVYLSSAGAAGELTGHIVGHRVDASPAGATFGRHETSVGEDFTTLEVATFGADAPATPREFRQGAGARNSAPRVSRVVINEIHYNPSDGDIEFVELYNRGAEDVPLHDAVTGRGATLSGLAESSGVGDYEFPPGTVAPSGGFVLLVPLDPEVYRRFRGVGDSVVIAGPYGGALANGGERLVLSAPTTLEDGDLGYIVLDRVEYDDRRAWPSEADGGGPSLERRESSEYGSEPLNWSASEGAGGTPGARNSVSDPPSGGGQIPGDLTQDGRLNVADAVGVLSFLFAGDLAPPCDEQGTRTLLDVDGSGSADISDPVLLLNYLFGRGTPPALGTVCVVIEGCPAVCREH